MRRVRVVRFSDGAGLNILANDKLNTRNWVSNIAGWYEGAEPETDRVSRTTDGTFQGELRREGRAMTISGRTRCADNWETLDLSRRLSGAFRSGKPGEGFIEVEDLHGVTRSEGVGLDGRPRVDHDLVYNTVTWELPVYADDPYIYGPVLTAHVETAGIGVGLVFPLFDDTDAEGNVVNERDVLGYGEQASINQWELINQGNHPAYPVVTVFGNFPSGFSLQLTGDGPAEWGVTYRGEVTMQAPVVIDFRGRALVEGMDRSWMLTQRDWGGVEPRGGRVTAILEPVALGSGWAEIAMRSTYL